MTVGEQRFMSIMQSNIPRIVEQLTRIADALEKRNELLARQEVIETADMPLSHDALRGYMLEAMGRTPHDKREEGSHG